MEKKFGVYICTGCDIGESLDIEALKSESGSHPLQMNQLGA